jgi:hypothetical protein
VVRQFVRETFGKRLARSSCVRSLQRLGFVWKRPKNRVRTADAERQAAFVREDAALAEDADRTGATICFVDAAHVRADADLRGTWVLTGRRRGPIPPAHATATASRRAPGRRSVRRPAWSR